jgi:hypothetical protein
VRFAEHAENTATFGRRTYAAARFRRACPAAKPTMLTAGTFLEIIELDGEDHEVIRCHPMTTTMNNLPTLFPPRFY